MSDAHERITLGDVDTMSVVLDRDAERIHLELDEYDGASLDEPELARLTAYLVLGLAYLRGVVPTDAVPRGALHTRVETDGTITITDTGAPRDPTELTGAGGE